MGVVPGAVTKRVCVNTPTSCEVYMKKGIENGATRKIESCKQCVAQKKSGKLSTGPVGSRVEADGFRRTYREVACLG